MSGIPRTVLGTTAMEITRIGFGAWAIGGGDWAYAWGPQDDEESIGAIRFAVESGINWIDTAAVYGLGHSEEVIARALADFPEADRPFIFTKGGLVWDDDAPGDAPARVGSPASLRREVEASLRRLGTDRIDLYQMHWPAEDGADVSDYWGALTDLRAEGKIRAAGLSNHDVDQLVVAEAIGHVDTVQPPFSAMEQSARDSILPWCETNETGVIVYSPMGSGLLSGAFSAARVQSLAADDWRKTHPDFTTKLEHNLAIAAALKEVARRHGTSQAAAAIAWTLQFSAVSGAIVGARRPGQIADWLDAASIGLDEDELRLVHEAASMR